MDKNNFNCLSQFDGKVLDLVKQQGFYLYEYMSDFEKFKEKLPNKEKLYSSLSVKKLVIKSMNLRFEMKTM